MITLATIPARFHEALASERVDVKRGGWSGPLVALDDEGIVIAGGRGLHAVTRARFDEVTVPPTDRNARALAVVLAQACGLDVSRGVLARLTGDRLLWLEVNTSTDGVDLARAGFAPRPWRALHRGCPAFATINPTAPDALFRALCACLCALETAP